MPERYAPAFHFAEEVIAAPLNWWIKDTLTLPFTSIPITKRKQFEVIRDTLQRWSVASAGRITFRAQMTKYPAIIVLFKAGDHGDPYPFDGPGRVLAHAYLPFLPSLDYTGLVGDIHFDEAEDWDVRLLELVALHEEGHAIGLPHVDDPQNIMYPYIQMGHSGLLAEREIKLLYDTYGWS